MKAKVNIYCKCSTRGRKGVTGAIQEKWKNGCPHHWEE